jgi:hypothetical protein
MATKANANAAATAAALKGLLADTLSSDQPLLNDALIVDWNLLAGETRTVFKQENGVEESGIWRRSFVDLPQGGKVFRSDGIITYTLKGQVIGTETRTDRHFPATGLSSITSELVPSVATQGPWYNSLVVSRNRAFSAGMYGRSFDQVTSPGVVPQQLLYLVIAAMPGDLPETMRVWVLNPQGEVVPADVKRVGKVSLEELIGDPNVGCDGKKGKRVTVPGVKLQIGGGLPFETVTVREAAPHFLINPDVVCRVYR